jgi:hypothetical protein
VVGPVERQLDDAVGHRLVPDGLEVYRRVHVASAPRGRPVTRGA